jgi:hypothetical protein
MTGAGPGWRRIAGPGLAAWAAAAAAPARAALVAGGDWRCGGTWFVGVDALPNDAAGGIGGVAFPWGETGLAPCTVHRAQVSATRPGYPQRDPGEGEGAFRFRKERDGAHLDGLLPVGPERRRMVKEPHAWVLGVGLAGGDPGAAPLVVWEGSQRILGPALARALARAGGDPASADVTEAYVDARAEALARCPRRALPMRPGEGVVLHRHLLHGVAPWTAGAEGGEGPRIVAYFRPCLADAAAWADLTRD